MMRLRSLTLTNRLLLFILGTLFLVLVCFSLTLLALASYYLHRQIDDQLDSATRTLVAAAEVTTMGVEWEPSERLLSIRDAPWGGNVYWTVAALDGQLIDRASAPGTHQFEQAIATSPLHPLAPTHIDVWETDEWKISRTRILPAAAATGSVASEVLDESSGRLFAGVVVTVGVPVGSMKTVWRTLALGLAGLSLTIELVVMVIGRWLCYHALTPVRRIAKLAETMSARDLSERLPPIETMDELAGLVRSFNELLDRVQDSFERQKRFSGDASHQLRTPLTAMLGQVDVALRRQRPVEEYERVLTTVKLEAVHLSKIIESLLYLARTDAQLPELERIDVTQWFATYARQWHDHARASDLRFESTLIEPAVVRAHALLLAELWNNVLSNALKYSRPGTTVTMLAARKDKRIAISVTDHGSGIAAQERTRVLAPFYRCEEARQNGIPGTGLGLTIAARIADLFAAQLDIHGVASGGTCVTLTFPA